VMIARSGRAAAGCAQTPHTSLLISNSPPPGLFSAGPRVRRICRFAL
jgi:hypothetical protein